MSDSVEEPILQDPFVEASLVTIIYSLTACNVISGLPYGLWYKLQLM